MEIILITGAESPRHLSLLINSEGGGLLVALNIRLKHKRDTEENWTASNPILLNGELVIIDCSDGSIRLKIGDGTSNYASLTFLDADLRDLIAANKPSYTIQSITQDEYDSLTTKDDTTLYIIEV